MKADVIAFKLLEADGEYVPEGYELLDTVDVGDYTLKLWQGEGHVRGVAVKFYEISLNAHGRSFAPEEQNKKFATTMAMPARSVMRVVGEWIKRYGGLYIGSYSPRKLATYHHMFKRYLPQLKVSDPFAPFDECEGKPEYFTVNSMPSALERALAEAIKRYDAQVKRGQDQR
jgi:hypothetical protein